jgi:hypothetical protein
VRVLEVRHDLINPPSNVQRRGDRVYMSSSKRPDQRISGYVVGSNRPSLCPPCCRRSKRAPIPRAVWIEASRNEGSTVAAISTSVWMLTLPPYSSWLGCLESLPMYIVSIGPPTPRASTLTLTLVVVVTERFALSFWPRTISMPAPSSLYPISSSGQILSWKKESTTSDSSSSLNMTSAAAGEQVDKLT